MVSKRVMTVSCLGALAIGACAASFYLAQTKTESDYGTSAIAAPASLKELLALPPASLSGVDIARMNLLCAQGLPGAEDLDVASSLAMLDQMAERVRSETERHFYRFRQNPSEFENSEGYFRMIAPPEFPILLLLAQAAAR
jgi:hypothetical protein